MLSQHLIKQLATRNPQLATMAEHHKLPVTRTAHYYTLGTPGKHIKRLWIVAHGYAQLASTFIHRFESLEDGATLVIAPEALSKFYWGKFTGKVVASWMTSGDRLDEIADYSNYLQQIYDEYVPQLAPDVQITLLGFSQGTATVVRWALAKHPIFHNLVLWAGAFPEDIPYHEKADYWTDKKCYFMYGTQDQLMTEKRRQWSLEVIKEKKLDVSVQHFDGKHVVDKAAFAAFVKANGL